MTQGWSLPCEAIAWVDKEWPGWIRVRLLDANGRPWHLIDKVPVFGLDIGPEAAMPLTVDLPCDVTAEDGDLVIIVPRWGIEADDGTTHFRVRRDQLRVEDAD